MSLSNFTDTINGVDYSGKGLQKYVTIDGDKTLATILDASFSQVGSWVKDSSTNEESFVVKLPDSSTSGYKEEGYYKADTNDAGFSWVYNYDSSNAFTGGSETVNNVTSTLDASWQVTAASVDTSKLTTLSGQSDIDLLPNSLVLTNATTSAEYALYNVKGDETTYFSADGAILGYKYTWSDGSFSGTTFYDSADNLIGDTFTDGYLVMSNFFTDNGDGTRTESGTYKETDGASTPTTLFERSYSYVFNTSTGDFVSGSEVVDGETTTYGANWAVQGKSVDVSALITAGTIAEATAPDDVPTSFVIGGKVYTSTENFTWGDTETTYYDNTSGAVIGRAVSFSNTYNGVTSNGTTYFDDDWNWVGDVFSDGTWTSRRFEKDNGNGTKTETGFETDGSGWSREWVFVFDNSGTFISGSETQNGVTTTFGANWEVTGKSADTSNLARLETKASLDALPDSFVLTDSTTSTEYALYKVIENPWGNETTYFDASGSILGYAFSWQDSFGSGTSYNDADWNYIGDTFTQGTFTSTRFETQNSDGTRTEVGSEYDDGVLLRSWTFKFDANFNLIEGEEVRDGITTQFGAGWQILGEKADTSSLTAVSDVDVVLAGAIKLSDVFDFSTTVDGATVATGLSSSKQSDWGTGTEITYYNASGEIVGREQSYSFDFQDYQGTTVTQTGKTYFDAEWNWVGDIFDDGFFSGSRFDLKLDGGGRREVGSEGDNNFTRSFDFIFDAQDQLVSGTEIENGTTTTYGANWVVQSRTADTSNLLTLTDAAVLAEIPSTFVINNTAYYTENTGNWGTERTYFDASGVILGYSNSWNDNWGSGTSFNDVDWNFLGDVFIQGDFKNVRFETEATSDGTYGNAGDTIRVETGSEYRKDTNGDFQLERSWTFNFDNNYNMLGGIETRGDGTEVTFGANWIIQGEKVSLTNLTPISDLSVELTTGIKLSDVFDFSVSGVTTLTGYSQTKSHDYGGGTETIYYNQNGEIVGRANSFEKTPDQQDYTPPLVFARGMTTSGGYIDFLGIGVDGLVTGYDGVGITIPIGWSSDVTITSSTTSAEILALLGGSVDLDLQIADTEAYGPGTNWLAQLPSSIHTISESNGVTSGTLKAFKYTAVNTDSPVAVVGEDVTFSTSDNLAYDYFWNGNSFFTNTLTNTQFNVSGTDVIAAQIAKVNANPPSNVQYFDEDWNWLGEKFESVNDTRTVFNIENADGTRTEYGSEGNAYYARSWEFDFAANGDFLGGTEKENGVERQIDSTGKVAQQSVDPTKLEQLTDTTLLDALPDALVFSYVTDDTTNPVTTAEKALYLQQMYPGGVDTMYFDATGAALGRAQSWSDGYGSGTDYFDANDEFLGNTFAASDGSFSQSRFETKTKDASGNVIEILEVGSETSTFGTGSSAQTTSREWTFKFDGNFNLIEGTEKVDGVTTTFGANWKILAEKVTISTSDSSFVKIVQGDLDAQLVNITGESTATGIANGVVKLSDVFGTLAVDDYKKTATNDWGGDETTYYTAAGEIIGRTVSDTFTFYDQFQSADITQTNVQYYDADWNWLGDTSSDGTFSRKFFVFEDTTAGTRTEVSDESGGNFSRKAVFNFTNDQFTGGIEIENGVTYQVASDFTRQAEALSSTALDSLKLASSAVTSSSLPVAFAELPNSFKFGTVDGQGVGTDIYLKTIFQDTSRGDWQIDYYDVNGDKIGESFTFTDKWSGEKVTSFNDANYNWIGDVRVKANEFKQVFTRSESGSGTSKTTTEVMSRSEWDATNSVWVEIESSSFVFDNNFNLVSGTEVRNGVTTTYGANWVITGTKADLTKLANVSAVTDADKATAISGSTVTLGNIFADAVNKSTESFTDFYTGGTNVQTTYYDASGDTLGRSYENTFVDTQNNKTFVNIFFEDKDYNWIGDARLEGTTAAANQTQTFTFQQSFFKVDDQPSAGKFTEYFSETNGSSARSSKYVYLDNGDAVSGEETENGVTTQLTVDSNGNWVREAAQITLTSNMEVTSSAALAELPPPFVQDVDGNGTPDTAYVLVTRDDTANNGGKEYTYFSQTGVEIGRAFEFTNYFGEKVIDFQDINHNFLGSVRTKANQFKEVRFEIEETSDGTYGTDGDPITKETGASYNWNSGTSSWDLDREWTFYFDDTFYFLGGTEEQNGQKFIFGENWALISSQFTGSVSDLKPLQIEFLVQNLPEHWTTGGSVVASEVVRTDANWDYAAKFTAYVNQVEIGTIDIVADFTTGSPQTGELTDAQFTIYDKDKVTVIGNGSKATDSSGTVFNSFYSSPTSQAGDYKDVYKYRETDANNVVTDESITVEEYDQYDVYTGGSFTYGGVTSYYDASGTVTSTNNAPVVTLPGVLAGTIVEDATQSSVTGTLAVSDADGDTISATLMNLTGGTQVVDGDYGTLTFTPGSLGYTYVLDNNMNDVNVLMDGDVVYDSFFVEVKDLVGSGPDFYHTTYKELKFKIEGSTDQTMGFSVATGADKLSAFVGSSWSDTADIGFTVEGTGTNAFGVLTAGEIAIDKTTVRNTLDSIGTNGNFGISVTLDQMANMAPTAGRLEIIIRDDNGTGDDYHRETGEREIRTQIDVEVSGNGNGATIEAKQGDAVINYTRGDGTGGAVTLNNAASDFFSISGSTVNSPSSLNLKLDTLLSGLGNLTDVDMLSDDGLYTYEVRGLQNFLGEMDTYSSPPVYMPVSDVRGSIKVGAGNGTGQSVNSGTSFSLDIAGTNNMSITSGTWSQNLDLSYQNTGSNAGILMASLATVDAQVVRDNINGMGTQSNFGISAKLDQMANMDRDGTIEIIIRDVLGTGEVYAREGNEREIKASFDVNVLGDGSSANVTADAGTSVVSYTKSNGQQGTLMPNLSNSIADVFSVGGLGAISSPASLSVKLDKLLNDLGSITNVDMLSSAGRYSYEINGLGNFVTETNGSQQSSVSSIKGEIQVTGSSQGPSDDVDIDAVELSYDSPASGQREVYDLLVADKEVNGDKYVEIKLNSSGGDVIAAADVNDLTNPGVSFAPNLKIDLGNAIDLGTGKIDKTVKIEILEVDSAVGNTPRDRDYGERMLELEFNIERRGDGSSETWTSKTGGEAGKLNVSIWDGNELSFSTKDTAADHTFSIDNADVDTFIIPEAGSTSTPNSIGIKLESVLDKIETLVGSTPTANAGDEFMLMVSFANEDGSQDMLVAGDFILS